MEDDDLLLAMLQVEDDDEFEHEVQQFKTVKVDIVMKMRFSRGGYRMLCQLWRAHLKTIAQEVITRRVFHKPLKELQPKTVFVTGEARR